MQPAVAPRCVALRGGIAVPRRVRVPAAAAAAAPARRLAAVSTRFAAGARLSAPTARGMGAALRAAVTPRVCAARARLRCGGAGLTCAAAASGVRRRLGGARGGHHARHGHRGHHDQTAQEPTQAAGALAAPCTRSLYWRHPWLRLRRAGSPAGTVCARAGSGSQRRRAPRLHARASSAVCGAAAAAQPSPKALSGVTARALTADARRLACRSVRSRWPV